MQEIEQIATEVQNDPPKLRKDGRKYPALQERMVVFGALTAAGMDPARAHQIANQGKRTTPDGVRAAQKRIQSYQLARPRRVAAAARAVDETLAMFPVKVSETKDKDGNVKEVKYTVPTVSNRLEAAKMVLDRADPVHQVHEHLHPGDYSPLDMARFELIPREKVIDQAPEDGKSEDNQQDTV